ncbi:MAG: IS3 family transposase [Lentisphaeria bacterium]|nr:IS3 family transposase [Lentisphaeria bacterium]
MKNQNFSPGCIPRIFNKAGASISDDEICEGVLILRNSYYHSFEELEKTVSEYIDFFNGMRPHQKMGNLTPDEIERRYYEN